MITAFLSMTILAALGSSLSMSPSLDLAPLGAMAALAWTCPPAAMLAGGLAGVKRAKANLPLAWASLGEHPLKRTLPRVLAKSIVIAAFSMIAAFWLSPMGLSALMNKMVSSTSVLPTEEGVSRIGPDTWIALLSGGRVMCIGHDRGKKITVLRGWRSEDGREIVQGTISTDEGRATFQSLTLPSRPSPIVSPPAAAKPGPSPPKIVVVQATLLSVVAGFLAGMSRKSLVLPATAAAAGVLTMLAPLPFWSPLVPPLSTLLFTFFEAS